MRYARPRDWAEGAALSTLGPGALILMERVAPSYVGRGGFAPMLRLCGVLGGLAGFFYVYDKSSCKFCTHYSSRLYICIGSNFYKDRFYGVTENKRELDMDMREMVDRVKKGEPLYGKSSMTEYMQGVAARNSRLSSVFHHLVPWFNFVNHEHVSPRVSDETNVY